MVNNSGSSTLLGDINRWLYRNRFLLLQLAVFLNLVVIFLFFDLKPDLGGDDAGYIVASKSFVEGTSFPTWHGSFYPIFLSPFVALWGINLPLLKMVSVFLVLAHILILFRLFSDSATSLVFASALLVTAFNYELASLASTTYSEPLYLLLQGLVIIQVFRLEQNKHENRQNWLLLGLLMFLLSITRNIGLGIILAVVFFYLMTGRYRFIYKAVGGFLLFHIPFYIYKTWYWHLESIGFEAQLQNMFRMYHYEANAPQASIWELANRFVINSDQYLSGHLLSFVGLPGLASKPYSITIVIFLVILFFGALDYTLRNKRRFAFIGIYLAVSIGATFLTQQVHWNQERLMIIYLPLILVFLGEGIFGYIEELNLKRTGYICIGIFMLLPILTLVSTFRQPLKVQELVHNIKGEEFYGFPAAWKNYMKISRWAGKNLPSTANILCRKAGLSAVYGGRTFTGFYQIPEETPEDYFRSRNIDFVIAGSTPMNTVERYLEEFVRSNPYGISMVKEIGAILPMYVFKLEYHPPKEKMEYIERLYALQLLMPTSRYPYELLASKLYEYGRKKEAGWYESFSKRPYITD